MNITTGFSTLKTDLLTQFPEYLKQNQNNWKRVWKTDRQLYPEYLTRCYKVEKLLQETRTDALKFTC